MNRELPKQGAECLFNEYSEYVFKIALLLTKSKVLADDIVQETFLRIFNKYYTFDSSKNIQPWIYKITLNVTRNTIRKQKWLSLFNEIPDKTDLENVENLVLKSEANKELWEAINNLSLKSKEIIVLHFYSDLKLTEISEVLAIPLGTCKSRLNYALNALRKHINNNTFYFNNKGGNLYDAIQ